MSAERKKVLEMLAAGKISAEDAEKLLEKLSGEPGREAAAAQETPGGEVQDSTTAKKRYLRIQVDEPNGKKVNMRVPLAFIRSGMALMGVLPERVQQRLSERGIDIGLIAGIRNNKDANLQETLQELNVNVDEPDGKRVRIYSE